MILVRAAMTLLLAVLTTATAWAISGNWSDNKASAFSVINETAKTISITSPAELALLAYNVTTLDTDYSGYTITLTKDLDMSAHYWDTPIGKYSSNHGGYNSFRGTFNGGNHTISGIINNNSTSSYQGLFGYVGKNNNPGTVSNLTLASSTITGKESVGGIVGCILNGTISNCHVLPSVSILAGSDNSKYHGGIVGLLTPNKTNTTATIQNCTCGATITSGSYSNCSTYGGIVGYYSNSSITNTTLTNCFYYGTSVSANSSVGAIVGSCWYTDGISNCYYHYPSTINGFGDNSSVASVMQVYQLTLGTGTTGLTLSGTPTYTFNGTHYYAANTTITAGITSNTQVIKSLSASSGTINNVTYSNDRRSATFTMGSSDVTLTATLQTISGTCGTNATWSLADKNNDGTYETLTIGGTGAMNDYSYTTVNSLWRTNAPWGWQDITTITIGDGITRIGNYAFIGAQDVVSVTIGNSVASIGIGAINHCDQMTTITLPASVATIGYAAFENCQALTTVYINNTGAVSLTGSNNNHFNAPNLQYIAFSTPAGALANTQTSGNWSRYKDNIRTYLGSQFFLATNEGGIPAYQIATATDWNNLATAVNGGATGSGQTFRQTANITVNNFTPIGSSEANSFRGTYDGGNKTMNVTINNSTSGTATFAYINGASIKNLTLAGSITGGQHCAALVGFAKGTNTIENVNVTANVSLHSSVASSKAHHGGVVGHALSSTTTLRGVVYSGTISSTAAYNNVHVGGLVGWADAATVTIENSLFCGTYDGGTLFHPVICKAGDQTVNGTFTNVYYTTAPTSTNSNEIVAGAGKQPRSVTAGQNVTQCSVNPKGNATATYSVSGITAYNNGLSRGGTFYFGNEDQVSLTLSHSDSPTGYTFTGYTATNGGTITGTTNPFTLTMPNSDVTVNGTMTPNTYTVSFDANGGTGEAMANMTFTYDQAQALTANTFTRTGYTFAGWNTAANGGGNSYDDGQEVSNLATSGTVTLYAQWTANTYTVHFDGNGSTGSLQGTMADQSFTYDVAQNLTANAFTRTNYVFTGWNTQADGKGTGYDDGQEVINLATSGTVTLYAQWTFVAVAYLDENGQKQYCNSYTLLTGTITNTGLADGWYVAEGEVTFKSTIQVNGDAHLILKDGAVVYVGTEESPVNIYGILADGHSLSIYGQSTGEDKGQLHVYSSQYGISANNASVHINGGEVMATGALYGINVGSDCAVTINGGEVTATGTTLYGIYTSSGTSTVTINGGQVTANGDRSGICAKGIVTISSGEVKAIGTSYYGIYTSASNSSVIISGGDVTAFGKYYGIYAHRGSVTIDDGLVTVNGGHAIFVQNSDGTVTVNGGAVTATGTSCGIYTYNSGAVAINGGEVTANGPAIGIFANNGTVTISGGEVTANGTGDEGCGIYANNSGSVSISGGAVTATGDYGIWTGGDCIITLGWTNATDFIFASNYGNEETGTISIAEGKAFMTEDGTTYGSGTLTSEQLEALAGKKLYPSIPGAIFYLDMNGEKQLCAEYTTLTGNETSVPGGWYAVLNDISYNNGITFSGNAHLILGDGKTMTANGEFSAVKVANLTIYGQRLGTGKLIATGNPDGEGDGINAGDVTINGGQVTASGSSCGIYAQRSVTINGGQVTATGYEDGGIWAEWGKITLGWNRATDFIHVNSYDGNISIKEGKDFIDEDGTLHTSTNVGTLNGKTLRPNIMTLFAEASTSEWMTWCGPDEWTVPDDCTVYTVVSVDDATVTLVPLSNPHFIPAYTPVIVVRNNTDGAVTATFSGCGTGNDGVQTADGTTGCTFYGTTTELSTTDFTPYYTFGQTYVLYNGMFLLYDTNNGVPAHRCWLNVSAPAAARLDINLSETTSLNDKGKMINDKEAAAWYTLDGRKLDGKPAKKGVYVNNGNKTVIK